MAATIKANKLERGGVITDLNKVKIIREAFGAPSHPRTYSKCSKVVYDDATHRLSYYVETFVIDTRPGIDD